MTNYRIRLGSLFFFVFCLTFAHLTSAIGQPTMNLKGKVLSITLDREDNTNVTFRIKLAMELTNKSSEPVMLLRHDPWLSSEIITASVAAFENGDYLYKTSVMPSNDISNRWQKLRHSLDIRSPPGAYIRYISPNDVWKFEIETVIDFDKDGKGWQNKITNVNEKGKGTWIEIKGYQYLWMKLEFQLWPLNLEPCKTGELNFGKKLRKQWQDQGYLWLNAIVSDPIQFDLRNAGVKAP